MTDTPEPITTEQPKGRIARTFGKTFSSLHNRNFRLYFIGQLISNTGNWLTNVALTLLVLKITKSGFDVGLVAACQFGPVLFLSAKAGAIADRTNKRTMLFLTQGLEMAQSIGLAIVAFMPHPSLGALYTLAIAGGTILAFDNPLRRSFVSEMVPEKDIPNAVVMYSTIINVSRIFGPALAGLLVVTLGYGWCFSIDAATYIAVITCIFLMRPKDLYRPPKKPRVKGEVREGLRYLMSEPVLWISFAMLAAIGTLAYNFSVTFPLFVTGSLHSSVGTFTILYSIFSFGAVVSALIVAHRGLVKLKHVIIGATALGMAMILLALSPSIAFALPIVFFVGMSSILYMTSSTALVQVGTRREMQGRLLALQTVLIGGTGIIGGPLSGWLSDVLGARAPLILGGVVCLISAAFGYVANKRRLAAKPQTSSL